MQKGWHFEFFFNELDTYTAVARKGKVEISTDAFSWWELVTAIVAKVDEMK